MHQQGPTSPNTTPAATPEPLSSRSSSAASACPTGHGIGKRPIEELGRKGDEQRQPAHHAEPEVEQPEAQPQPRHTHGATEWLADPAAKAGLADDTSRREPAPETTADLGVGGGRLGSSAVSMLAAPQKIDQRRHGADEAEPRAGYRTRPGLNELAVVDGLEIGVQPPSGIDLGIQQAGAATIEIQRMGSLLWQDLLLCQADHRRSACAIGEHGTDAHRHDEVAATIDDDGAVVSAGLTSASAEPCRPAGLSRQASACDR